MSPKVSKSSPASGKKAVAKKPAKVTAAPAKKGKVVAEPVAATPLPEGVDAEEAEEAADEAAAAASGGGGNAAALAAAGGGEMSASFKNFRHHPDMENFYRFIFENDLRHEALAILDTIMNDKQALRAAKAAQAKSGSGKGASGKHA